MSHEVDNVDHSPGESPSMKATLIFKPPGSSYNLAISYHEGDLPVCGKCKNAFKSRNTCRIRSGHTAPPWTPAYVCITLDDTCIDQRITCENDSASTGKIHLVDLPLEVKPVAPPSTRTKQFILDSSPMQSSMPSCLKCKRSTRSKFACRTQNKHSSLPWNTVFATVGHANSSRQRSIQQELPMGIRDTAISQQSDDIRNVQPSLTFLIEVSCLSISLQWLTLNPLCASTSPVSTPVRSVAMILPCKKRKSPTYPVMKQKLRHGNHSNFIPLKQQQQQQVESRLQSSFVSAAVNCHDEHNVRLGVSHALPQRYTQLQQPSSLFLSPDGLYKNNLPNVVLTLPRNDYEVVMNRPSTHNNMNHSWARQSAIDSLSRHRLIQHNPMVTDQGRLVPNQESSLMFPNDMVGTRNVHHVSNPYSLSAMQQLQQQQRSLDNSIANLQDRHQYRNLQDQQHSLYSLHQQQSQRYAQNSGAPRYIGQHVPNQDSSLILANEMVGARLAHHVSNPYSLSAMQQLQQQQRSLDSRIANVQDRHQYRNLQDQQQTLYSLRQQQSQQNSVAPRYIGQLVPNQDSSLIDHNDIVSTSHLHRVSNLDLSLQQLQQQQRRLDIRIANLQDRHQYRNLQDQQQTLYSLSQQQPAQISTVPVSTMAGTSFCPLSEPSAVSRQAQTVPTSLVVPHAMEPTVMKENASTRQQILQDVIDMYATHRMQACTDVYNVDDDEHLEPSKRFKNEDDEDI